MRREMAQAQKEFENALTNDPMDEEEVKTAIGNLQRLSMAHQTNLHRQMTRIMKELNHEQRVQALRFLHHKERGRRRQQRDRPPHSPKPKPKPELESEPEL
jgi:DNA-binding transcriptional ArsR family regulator